MSCNIKSLQGGKYQIESLLGSGGFANTYLATQTGLERKVAIKEFFMKEYCDRNESTSQVIIPTEGSKLIVDKYKVKFLKEAQMIASLKNEHIIQIYDIFEENDTAYYVMEYVSAGSLKDTVEKNGPMSEARAVRYIHQVADALCYLHSNNILHLDVKPANILLNDKDAAILIDFGISKHYDEAGGQTSTTPAGISKGYAPIEQYQQGSIANFSPATDVYSLGATLFFLLTGETPPEASALYEDGLPAVIDNFSESIRKTIETAMSSKRKERFQTVGLFVESLDAQMLSESPVTEKTEAAEPVVDSEETIIISPQAAVKEPVQNNNAKVNEVKEIRENVNIVKESDIDPDEEKIGGWMAFFLWGGIGLGLVVTFVHAFSHGFVFYSLLSIALFALIGIKAIWAFYKKKENAVPLAMTYCIMVGMDALCLALINLISNDSESWGVVLRSALWAGIWFTYLKCSDSVRCRFPEETRKWHKLEKGALVAAGVLYAVLLIIVAATNRHETQSVYVNPKPQTQTAPNNKTQPTGKPQTSTTPTATTPAEPVDVNAEKLATALRQKNYSTVKKLADGGYAPAYLPLAKYYLQDPSTHAQADKYAKKAKAAGYNKAQEVIDNLDALGFYE